MIKTEYLDDSDLSTQNSKHKHWQVVAMLIIVAICLAGLASFIEIKFNASKVSTLAPKNNTNGLNLLLPSSPNNSLKVSNSQPSTTQSPTNSTSLGSSSYNLQDNTPTSNNSQPTISSLQSTDTAQNTGQSINPNLPY